MKKTISESDKKIIISENPIIKKAMKINSSMVICEKLLEDEENSSERLLILERYHSLNKEYTNTLTEFILDYGKKIDGISERYESMINTLTTTQKDLVEANKELVERIKADDLQYSEFLKQLAYSATVDPDVLIKSLVQYVEELEEPLKIQSFVKGILN